MTYIKCNTTINPKTGKFYNCTYDAVYYYKHKYTHNTTCRCSIHDLDIKTNWILISEDEYIVFKVLEL